MDKFEIDGIEYFVTMTSDGVEVQYLDKETGLENILLFDELLIIRNRIRTTYEKFILTPTGKRINKERHRIDTPLAETKAFHQSALANVIKKFIVNGMLRYFLGVTYAVYDQAGNPIETQPIPFPEE